MLDQRCKIRTDLTEIQGEVHESIITAGDVNILAAVIDSESEN